MSTAENVVLEEEYDPDYVPTKEEIQEYAEFLGMDLTAKEDQDLVWIAEQGLKAPLPSDWKPCKTDDKDIYYFNFETGESRWEHPCDEYYKDLYRNEKIKQMEKQKKQKQARIFLPSNDSKKAKNITDNFDSLFQNEIEGILESDIVSSEHSLSPLKPDPKNEPNPNQSTASNNPPNLSVSKPLMASTKTKKNPIDVADKLQAELDKLVSKTDSSSIPTFHMDLSSSRQKSRDKLDEEYYKEKQLYLESLEHGLQKFKEDSKREKMSKMEEKLEGEIQTFQSELENKMKRKEESLRKRHQEEMRTLQLSLENEKKINREKVTAKHKKIMDEIQAKHESKVKEMDIAYNRQKNEVLTVQKEEIQKLKEQHQESLVNLKAAMSSDVDNLTKRRQSIQEQNESLESFKMNTEEMEKDHDSKLDELRKVHEQRLRESQSKWNEEFESMKRENEQKFNEFVEMMENKKMDHISDKETSAFKDKYAADIQSRKEKIKAAMHKEHEEWKEQKKRYYAQCRGKETAKYEQQLSALTDELMRNMKEKREDQEQEMATLDRMHDVKMNEIKEKLQGELDDLVKDNESKLDQIKEETNRKCDKLEKEMMDIEQSKRDELRKEYKEKYGDLVDELQSQNHGLEHNMNSSRNNVPSIKLAEFKNENERLQSDLDEVRAELKEEKILFSTEKRELVFQIDDLRQTVLNYENQINRLNQAQAQRDRIIEDQEETEHDTETINELVVDDDHDAPRIVNEIHASTEQGLGAPFHGRDDAENEEMERMDQQSIMCSTYANSEFAALCEIDLNESNELPSTASKWSEYLQRERESINGVRVAIAAKKKMMRQKQRRLEESQMQWKKDRDKLKMMTMSANFSDHKQFHSIKSMLKKKKYDLDEHVYNINEQILEIRESSEQLKKRESRVQRLEIEYMRTQGVTQQCGDNAVQSGNNPNNHNISGKAATLLNSQQSMQSIPLMPHPPTHSNRDISLESHPMNNNVYDYQSTQHIPKAIGSQQRVVIRSSSVGQQALGSVISKYVKHKQHALQAIDHHKSWLRSFQSEIRNMSNSIHSEETLNVRTSPIRKKRVRHEGRDRRHRRHGGEDRASSKDINESGQNQGEVLIRVKIEK